MAKRSHEKLADVAPNKTAPTWPVPSNGFVHVSVETEETVLLCNGWTDCFKII